MCHIIIHLYVYIYIYRYMYVFICIANVCKYHLATDLSSSKTFVDSDRACKKREGQLESASNWANTVGKSTNLALFQLGSAVFQVQIRPDKMLARHTSALPKVLQQKLWVHSHASGEF